MLEKTLESPLNWKIKPVNPKGNQSWVFIGRTDAKAEAPIFWPPDVKNWLIGKDPDAGKDWGQEEKETTEDEMVGWHHRLTGHGFEQAPGAGDGQGDLEYCSHITEWLNWTEVSLIFCLWSLPSSSCATLWPLSFPVLFYFEWNISHVFITLRTWSSWLLPIL